MAVSWFTLKTRRDAEDPCGGNRGADDFTGAADGGAVGEDRMKA